MRFNRAVGEVQPLTDLPVRQPASGHLRDLQLLRRELVARVGRALPAALSGRPQFPARTLAPVVHPERVERIPRSAQWRARLGHPPPAAKPLAERKLKSRSVERPPGEIRGERVAEERLGVGLSPEEWTGVEERNVEPRRGGLSSQRLKLAHDGEAFVALAAVRGGFGQITDRAATREQVMRRVARLEESAQVFVRGYVVSLSERQQAPGKLHSSESRRGPCRQRDRFGLCRECLDAWLAA